MVITAADYLIIMTRANLLIVSAQLDDQEGIDRNWNALSAFVEGLVKP